MFQGWQVWVLAGWDGKRSKVRHAPGSRMGIVASSGRRLSKGTGGISDEPQ